MEWVIIGQMIPTNKQSNYMEHSLWAANTFSARQEVLHILWKVEWYNPGKTEA